MIKKILSFIKLNLELGKVKITVSVTVTTTIGYFLYPPERINFWLWPVLGIFLIGLSSAALNQYQDRFLDAKMNRTKNRPLPSGRVSEKGVLIYILFYGIAGTLVLLLKTNIIATILGLSALGWYNGIYTYLKRVSPFAVIPGSVIGGVPPAIGWVAAGGDLFDPIILSVCWFMFIWQIPHFWLLLFLYGDDYARAGLPTLIAKIKEYKLRVWTFIGIFITVVSAYSIPFIAKLDDFLIFKALAGISILLLLYSSRLLFKNTRVNYKLNFIMLNMYSVLVLMILFVSHVYRMKG